MVDTYSIIFTTAGTISAAIVAAVVSYIAGRGMKRHEWQLMLVREKILARQRLYADFVSEADRLLLFSIQSKISDPVGFHDLLRKFGEIQLLARDDVTEAAKQMADHIILSHLAGEVADANAPSLHPLKTTFIMLAKQELKDYGA
ncbi:hypothetical protein ABCW43_14240 [Neorhizobium sp. IRAMC:178]|uniref:hypothetical protein n=1 Tax=Neorhizobium tunisiense TaxID=3144793 RepID=UPI0031F5FC9C